MKNPHSLLARQLRRHFDENLPPMPQFQAFVEDINESYHGFDADRAMLERSMDLSSRELIEINESLKRNEELLKKERDFAQMILDVAGVIILAIDLHGAVTLINRKGCDILGFKQDEILGDQWLELLIPERCRDDVSETFRKLLVEDTDLHEHFETPVRTKSGGERFVLWHNNTIRDKAGDMVGILSSGEDITNIKRAQDELKVRMLEIEKLNKFMIGREMRIIEMKKEVNELLKQTGQTQRYKV